MNRIKAPHYLTASSRASALIITLSLIVIVTILLTGFVTTARIERTMASSHYAGVQASLFAKIGTDIATARIEAATRSGQAWASAPGAILISHTASLTNPGKPELVDLSSGASIKVEADLSINLNKPSIIHQEGTLLSDPAATLPLKWIYVFADGTHLATDTIPPYNRDNLVTGRYAFWVDDESAKINFNTAGKRQGNTTSPSHPSHVNLLASGTLTSVEVDKIATFRKDHHLFNTIGEIAEASTTATEALFADKLSFTHFNHSPDRNLLNEPKIALTTNPANAGSHGYFDIVTPGGNPALLGDLVNTKVETLFKTLYAYLARKDWPLMEGKSFVDKYGPDSAAQIALDIIEYVRGADSTTMTVEPLRGIFDATKGTFKVDGNSIALLGNSRKPYITQIAARISPAVQGKWQCQYAIEVYLPPGPGTGKCNLLDYSLYVYLPNGVNSTKDITLSGVSGGQNEFGHGEYRTIIHSATIDATNDKAPDNPIPIRVALINKSTAVRLDIAPMTNQQIMYTYATPPPADVLAAEAVSVDDPFINKFKDDWKVSPAKFGRTGAEKTAASTLGTTSSVIPQQDTDSTGHITFEGVFMPPMGTGVASVGELGFIHTGGKGPATVGIPWRTLRLQPRAVGVATLPDWLLMDLFIAPVVASTAREKAVLEPQAQTSGGKINLNSTIYPFNNVGLAPDRLLPLQALLLGAKSASGDLTAGQAVQIAQAITKQTLANGMNKGNLQLPSDTPAGFYTSIGQIAEIDGVASNGEASEALVRTLAGVITVQSNVYSIYAVGESIRQTPSGAMISTGEKRTLTLLERGSNSKTRVISQKDLDL